MRPARCPCGVLASFKRPCKRCGRSLHLSHGHPPEDDPDHFERIEHEWFYTGGTHRTSVRGQERTVEPDGVVEGERCPYVHAHPYPFSDHEHAGGDVTEEARDYYLNVLM